MKRDSERTCIGCRGVFRKDDVIRIVAGPEGAVLDYREKLPGRAAYICPKGQCIEQALSKQNLARALRRNVRVPSCEDFIKGLRENIREKIKSLISISVKAGKLAAGYSAVTDAIEKKRVELLVYAEDISDGTREKIVRQEELFVREATVFTRDELGSLLNRELVGVVGLQDKGLADAVWRETERLKSLINTSE